MIEDIFKNTVKEYSLFKKKDRLIIGISGGPDSLFMLHQFSKIRKEYRLQLVCAHLNHGLRKESDQEEEFVKQVCKDLGIKCICEKKNVKSFFKGDSLEQTARNIRFDFFLNCARQTKIKKLALAHHKDDLVETVLMRLVKGSGLKGLQGFLPKSKFRSLTVIRPLINLRKKEILTWLKACNVSYCIDKSNFDNKFFRNHIRSELIPLLKKMNPNIINNLTTLARNISLDYDFIHSIALKEFNVLKRQSSSRGLRLDLDGLNKLSLAIFNNVLRIAIEEVKGHVRKLESRHLDELRDLVLHRPLGSIVDLPDLIAKKEEKTLLIQALIL